MKINFEKPDVPEYEIAKIVVEGAPRIRDAIEKTTAEVEAVIKRLGAAGESIDEMEQAWESYPEAIRQLYPEHIQAFFREWKSVPVKKLLNA